MTEVHKLLGSVDILGTPIQLGTSLIGGVASFFYEPAKGIIHGPEDFARGLAAGTMSLIKSSAYGVFSSVGQLAGGVGKGLAVLTWNDDYLNRLRHRPMTFGDSVLQGAHGFYLGV